MADLSSILRALSGGDKVAPPGTLSGMITGQKPEPSWWDDLNARVDASAPSEIVKRIASELGNHYNKGDLGSYASGGVDALANGLLMGHGADIRGNVRHALFGEDAGAEAAATQGQLDRFATDNPYTAGTAGVAGGVGAFTNPATAAVAAGILGRGATDAWGDYLGTAKDDPSASAKRQAALEDTGMAIGSSLPFVRSVGGGPALSAVARALFRPAGAGVAATGLAGSLVADALAAKKPPKRAASGNPKRVTASSQPDDLASMTLADPELSADPDVRNAALALKETGKTGVGPNWMALSEKLQNAIRDHNATRLPFEDRFGNTANLVAQGVGLLGPALAGLAMGRAKIARGNSPAWRKTVDQLDTALNGKDPSAVGRMFGRTGTPPNPALARQLATQANKFEGDYVNGASRGGVAEALKAAVPAAAAGATIKDLATGLPAMYNGVNSNEKLDPNWKTDYAISHDPVEFAKFLAANSLAGAVQAVGGYEATAVPLLGGKRLSQKDLFNRSTTLTDTVDGKGANVDNTVAHIAKMLRARSQSATAWKDAQGLLNETAPSADSLRAAGRLSGSGGQLQREAETLLPGATGPGSGGEFARASVPGFPLGSVPPQSPFQPPAVTSVYQPQVNNPLTANQGRRGLEALIGNERSAVPVPWSTSKGMEDIRKALMEKLDQPQNAKAVSLAALLRDNR